MKISELGSSARGIALCCAALALLLAGILWSFLTVFSFVINWTEILAGLLLFFTAIFIAIPIARVVLARVNGENISIGELSYNLMLGALGTLFTFRTMTGFSSYAETSIESPSLAAIFPAAANMAFTAGWISIFTLVVPTMFQYHYPDDAAGWRFFKNMFRFVRCMLLVYLFVFFMSPLPAWIDKVASENAVASNIASRQIAEKAEGVKAVNADAICIALAGTLRAAPNKAPARFGPKEYKTKKDQLNAFLDASGLPNQITGDSCQTRVKTLLPAQQKDLAIRLAEHAKYFTHDVVINIADAASDMPATTDVQQPDLLIQKLLIRAVTSPFEQIKSAFVSTDVPTLVTLTLEFLTLMLASFIFRKKTESVMDEYGDIE